MIGSAAYQENRWAVGEGMRLYNGFNCVGCHANGGGGIGRGIAAALAAEGATVFPADVGDADLSRPGEAARLAAEAIRRLLGLRDAGDSPPADFVARLYGYVARTPCRLLAVQLEDGVEELEAQLKADKAAAAAPVATAPESVSAATNGNGASVEPPPASVHRRSSTTAARRES